MTLDTLKQIFKFSWAQAFSDQSGKSSITAVSYFLVVVAGCIGFIKSIFVKDSNLTMWSVTVITAGLAAFTGKKIINGKTQAIPMEVHDPGTIVNTQTIAQVTTVEETTNAPENQ